MSINLPAVIQSLGGLLQPVQAPPLVNYDPGLVKKFVICLSKDLPSEELQLLQYYGRTISYDHDICNNIDLSTIDFSYFLLDLREANDRTYFQKIITPNIQMFHLFWQNSGCCIMPIMLKIMLPRLYQKMVDRIKVEMSTL